MILGDIITIILREVMSKSKQKTNFFIDINNKKLLKKVLTEKFLSDKIRESLRCDKVNGL